MPSREGAATTRGPNFATPPPRGVAGRREGRGAELPCQDEHGGVPARARRGGEDGLAVEPLAHLPLGQRERRPPLAVWQAAEPDRREEVAVEDVGAAGREEGDSSRGDARQLRLLAGDRVGHP